MVTRNEYIENLKQICVVDSKIRDYLNSDSIEEVFLSDVLVTRRYIHNNLKAQMRLLPVIDRIILTPHYLKYKYDTYKISKLISKYILRKFTVD